MKRLKRKNLHTMNKDENREKDPLSHFLNPEMVEKAPVGFASKVMTRIQLEPQSVRNKSGRRELSVVPYVSAAVILVLLLSSFFLSPGSNSSASAIFDTLGKIEIPTNLIDLSRIKLFDLPGWVPYMIAGLLFLSVFDRALYGLFHNREK